MASPATAAVDTKARRLPCLCARYPLSLGGNSRIWFE